VGLTAGYKILKFTRKGNVRLEDFLILTSQQQQQKNVRFLQIVAGMVVRKKTLELRR